MRGSPELCVAQIWSGSQSRS